MSIDIQKESQFLNNIPQDASLVLELLEKISNHTVELRNQLMSELRPGSNVIHLKLKSIE